LVKKNFKNPLSLLREKPAVSQFYKKLKNKIKKPVLKYLKTGFSANPSNLKFQKYQIRRRYKLSFRARLCLKGLMQATGLTGGF